MPPPPTRLNIRYFSWIRERIGTGSESVQPPVDVVTVADLVRWLVAQGGDPYRFAFEHPEFARAALDRRHVPLTAAIAGAHEVAFFPPVTGG